MEGIFNIVFDNLRLKINPESEAYCEQHNRINLAMAGAKLPIEREQRKVQKDFEKRIELFKTEQNDKFKDYMKDLNESLKQLEIETKRGARGMTALLQQLINNAAERRNSCTKDQFDKEVTSIVMQAKDFKKEQTCNLLQNLDKAEQTFLEKIYEMEMEAMKKFQDLKLDILNEIRSLYYIMFQGTNQLQLDLSEFRQQ
ncbi:hypothetical protein C0J52_08508 [Blattella germanica]|nr:hypothetical protein C0J52_08508 [Blattella germanica]